MNTIDNLSNEVAVKALSIVAKCWIRNRGLEAFIIVGGARRSMLESFSAMPSWAHEQPVANNESGELARKMLTCLKNGNDDEVIVWTDDALHEVSSAKGHVLDPVTLAIGGIILIGSILAARVKRIGPVEFYEGVPKELAEVLKAGSRISVPSE